MRTQRLVLKPPTGDDTHALVAHLDDFEVARWLSNVPHPYTLADAEEWIGIIADSARGEVPDFRLSIFMNDSLVGGVGLNHRSGNDYELGYWVAKDYWGRGIATEAAAGLMRYVQEALPDVNFIARCKKDNLASSRVLEKLGFRITGETETHSISLGAPMACFEYELR